MFKFNRLISRIVGFTLFLLSCPTIAAQESVVPTETNPVLVTELIVPRPSSIFSYCPDGTPLGTQYSMQRLAYWSCIDISPDGTDKLTSPYMQN